VDSSRHFYFLSEPNYGTRSQNLSQLLEIILEHIDIPKSLYVKAVERHRSLGEFLCREASTIRRYNPDVRPQGSFRYGTVVRPLNEDDEYDLDNVCVLTTLGKTDMTQRQLKELYGAEIKEYARQHGMLKAAEEHNRCWRLPYADEESFHLDTLPCIPEEADFVARLVALGIPHEWARRSIAITDKRHPQYDEITRLLFSSNPRGFAVFFEQQAALGREQSARAGQLKAAVEDVPPYEWKTSLQRTIQILKRHRDVKFQDDPDLAPISMIITNLSACAYQGERDIGEALTGILTRMPGFVRSEWPKVPNPANPAEDYADRWRTNPELAKSFWDWYYAAKNDFARLATATRDAKFNDDITKLFEVTLTADDARALGIQNRTVRTAAPALVIPSASRPWGKNG
jgi:Trp operon repressor